MKKKFEYREELNPSIKSLNILGEMGWELVCIYKIHHENQFQKYVFKREINQLTK